MFGASIVVSAVALWLIIVSLFSVEGNKPASLTKTTNMCLQGSPGLPGRNGANGHNGLPGRDGRDGAKGEKGVAGTSGARGAKGEPGRDGVKGEKGVVGPSGPRGVKGEAGQGDQETHRRNWKQCAWKNVNDGRDIGLIKDCLFNKTKVDTALRVVFQGNIYLGCSSSCCKRWFITFNGAECSGPLPIDAVLWIGNSGENNYRPSVIEGFCDNIHKGKIRVGINIGNCAGYGNSNGYTGWHSVSRLIIEEVPRS